MTMHHYIDSGTTKGSAVASCARPGVGPYGQPLQHFGNSGTLTALSFVNYMPETEECIVKKHWGTPLEGGRALWEKPQIYPTMMKRKAQEIIAHANDCIALAEHGRAAASFLSYGCGVRSVLPREWKKQVPKPQHHRAAWAVLTDSERALIASTYHGDSQGLSIYILQGCENYARAGKVTGYSAQVTDLLDAVCMMLWDTGRFRV